MRRANLLCGGFLVALGAASLLEALRIRDDWPGARLMPAVLALVLGVLRSLGAFSWAMTIVLTAAIVDREPRRLQALARHAAPARPRRSLSRVALSFS